MTFCSQSCSKRTGLKERAFSNSNSFDGREIVSLLDDEHSLHNQWVHGYLVLGGSKDLVQLVSRHRLTGIIITAALTPESMANIKQLAAAQHIRLSEWRFGETVHTQAGCDKQPLTSVL